MKKQKTHLNKMRPIYMLDDGTTRIIARYLGVSFGSYRFEVIADYGEWKDTSDRFSTGDSISIPKVDRNLIRELTPAEQILYKPKTNEK